MVDLSKFRQSADVKQDSDSLGGFLWESGAYPVKVDSAYFTEAASGAVGVVINLTNGSKDFRTTQYIQSGNAKGNKTTYTDKNKQEVPLPGFTQVNNLCLLTLGKEIADMATEKKTVNVYNAKAGKEIPTEVDMLTGLIGQEIIMGVVKQTVNKSVKSDSGAYVPTAETKDENEVDKFFRASDKMTVAETLAEAETAEFYSKWVEKREGVTVNKVKEVKAQSFSGGAAAGGGDTSSTTSLFNT